MGLGHWGPNLLRVLSGLESVDIKWIADLDVDRVGRMERRYPAARGTTRFDDILEDESVDAVVIATSVLTHFDLALRSLQAGKHTFVEKPLATSSDMADRLVAEAEERRLLLTCGHTFLYSPAVRAVKDLLVARALGDLFFVSSSRVKLGLHQRDVSVVWDLGPHDFSILLYWLEELPTSVRAVGRDSVVKGIPDVAFVTLVFASGLVANIELSWLAPSKLRRTVLVGNEGMVVYEDGAPEPIKVFDHKVVYEDPETFGEYHLSYRTGDIHTPKIETFEPLALELRDFVRAMETGSRMPGHLLLTKRIVRLTEAAEESLRSGGDVVALHPSDRFESLDSELPACVPGPRRLIARSTADEASSSPTPALTRPSRFLKRSMDFAIAGVALLVLLPVMLAAALAVALTSRGPVFYTQVRVGRDGRRFRMYKFRTMVEGADSRVEELRADSADPAWLLLERDPRVTDVGRFLRTTSIDELPQLVNVLKGEMSLVGPRPVTPEIDGHIDGWARRRVDMAPGMTGLWQVLGRTTIPFEEMLKLDYLYVTNWSLWQDLRLLVRTPPAVIKRRGVN